MPTPPTTVDDRRGATYRLGALLGRGAQGAVYATHTPRRVVKLVDTRTAAEREALTARFTFVRRLDLDGLHLASPLDLLAPPVTGYVMELLDEMGPLRALLPPGRPPPSLLDWYVSGGGLLRRLRLLAHAGEALAGLHARGLAFVDPSPHNVFVSTALDAHEAWLLDTDNVTVADVGAAIYTPPYGAPEVVRGETGPSTLADAHAFAALSFHALTLAHPLLGEAVLDGDPELEDEALEGGWPWIDHPEDDRNRATVGLPRDVTLSPRLRGLATRAFEAGLADRLARPSVAAWVDALHAASDAAVRCAACEFTFYVDRPVCPRCDAPAPAVIVGQLLTAGPHDGADGEAIRPMRRGVFVVGPDGFTLRRRHVDARTGPRARAEVALLRPVPRGIEIATVGPDPLVAAFDDGRRIELGPRPHMLPVDGRTGWALELRPIAGGRLRRAVRFTAYPRGHR